MIDKIYLNTNKILDKKDSEQVSGILKKAQEKLENDKKEDNFNYLLEEKINSEKILHQLKKKLKKFEEPNININLIPYPIHLKIQENQLNKIGKNKKQKCCKCGEIINEEDGKDIGIKNKTYICNLCLNKEISNFLNEFVDF